MQLRARSILLASRHHGETAAIVRVLTEEYGVVAGYLAGGRGRQLRPVVIPGNIVAADFRAKSDSQLPFARLELLESRGPWLTEPLPAAAIGWVCAITATALPERNAYPSIFAALDALLSAICHAPSARGWLPALLSFEVLLLRELGYGGERHLHNDDDAQALARFDALGTTLETYLLADRQSNVMAARQLLRERLVRMLT